MVRRVKRGRELATVSISDERWKDLQQLMRFLYPNSKEGDYGVRSGTISKAIQFLAQAVRDCPHVVKDYFTPPLDFAAFENGHLTT